MGEIWRCYCFSEPLADWLKLDKEIKMVAEQYNALCGIKQGELSADIDKL